jgi:hypothetical protein
VDEKLLNSIISVAYGDAPLKERMKIHNLAKHDKEVELLLKQHLEIAKKTRRLNIDAFPDELLDNVKDSVKVKGSEEKSLFYDIYSFIFMRPAVSAAIFSIIMLALISTFFFQRPEIHEQYSKQEIELADKQVKHSLALIASVFKKTTTTVEEDILTERVSKPIKESFNLVNEYLEEDKNENIN